MSRSWSYRSRRASAAALLSIAAAVPAHAAPPTATEAYTKENDAAMKAMMKDMHVPSSGDVDRDFIAMMIPHHQGAIDMARAQLRHGRSAELKALSRAIIAKQQEEIAEMHRMHAALGKHPRSGAAAKPAAKAEHASGHHAH